MKKIYIVTRSQIDDNFTDIDYCFTQIIIAETSRQAILIASDNCGKEGKLSWLYGNSDAEIIEEEGNCEHVFSDVREGY